MTLRSKLKIEKFGLNILSLFFVIEGIAEFFVLFLSNFRLFPIGILFIFSLTSAYALIKIKKWAVWFIVIRFFLGTTFGTTTLYASIMIQTFRPNLTVLSFHLMLIAYLIITMITTIYVLAKKKTWLLEN